MYATTNLKHTDTYTFAAPWVVRISNVSQRLSSGRGRRGGLEAIPETHVRGFV